MPGSALCRVIAVAAAVAAQASLAAPETLSLGHASVTFNRGGFVGSEPGAFSSYWAIPDVAGWGLTPDQHRVQATGSTLQIDFLPSLDDMAPAEESELRVWGGAFDSGSRYATVLEARAGMSLPLDFVPDAGYLITGYHATLAGDYEANPGDVNGNFTLAGSLGVSLQDGSRAEVARFELNEEAGGGGPLVFEADLPATADFSTLSGDFQASFMLDPPPADWPDTQMWGPFGTGGSEFEFRSLTIDVLTAPVPEPGSLLMLLTGLAGLATWQRGRRGGRTASTASAA